MIKFALTLTLLAGAIWFSAFYKLGDKPLVAHLEEIYQTPVVQQKVDALHRGLAGHVEKQPAPRRVTTATKTRAPMAPISSSPTEPPPVIDSRPQTGEKQKAPAHDVLTEEDRDGLDHLLSTKLKK